MDFTVVSEGVQYNCPYNVEYNSINLKLSFCSLRKLIQKNKPSILILWLDPHHFYLFPLLIYCQIKGIKTVYWNHGINLQAKRNVFRNLAYYVIHNLVSVYLLYSENERKYIKKPREKIFVANNTLNFTIFPEITNSKAELRKKYGIKEEKTVLFVGRIQKRKRLEQLLYVFNGELSGIGLVIVGSDLEEEHVEIIDRNNNIYYLGEIYDPSVISEVFKMCDIFCIPGAIGLSLNQAFFWELPVITTDIDHGPEIVYLKNGVNGYIIPRNDLFELRNKILYLLSNEEVYKRFSESAKLVIETEASIDVMFNGFMDSIDYLVNKE